MKERLRKLLAGFREDETGAIMTEYVVVLVFLFVGFYWFNAISDTLLFGAPMKSIQGMDQNAEVTSAVQDVEQSPEENSYIGRLSHHLSRP